MIDDFGEQLEASLDNHDNAGVIDDLDLHDPKNTDLLLDYIRSKKEDADITNHFPDQDAVTIQVVDTSIGIWRDEDGDTHVHVRDPDGNTHDVVLGREGYTEKL